MKNFNKSYIPYSILRTAIGFLFLIYIIAASVPQKWLDEPLFYLFAGLSLLVLFVLCIIYIVLYYNRTTYEINNDGITLRNGVFLKKVTILSYDRIHAVDKKEGLIQKLFNLNCLSIDSGSTTKAYNAEIIIYESKETIEEIMAFINSKRYNREIEVEETEAKEDFFLDSKIKNIYSLINSSIFLIFAIIFAIIGSALLAFAKDISHFLYIYSLSALSLGIFLYVVNLLFCHISFHDFRIFKKENELVINYGLFVKVSNKIAYDKIHGIIVSQNIFQRIFGFATIKISVVGYATQNNSNECISPFIPICRIKDVNSYIEKFVPSLVPNEKENKSPNYRFHHLASTIILSIILVAVNIMSLGLIWFDMEIFLTILFASVGAYLLILFISLILSVLEYRTVGYSINGDKLTLFKGSLISYTVVINKKHLIGVEKIETKWRRRNGVTNIVVHYFTNAMENTVKIPVLDSKAYEEIKELLNTDYC